MRFFRKKKELEIPVLGKCDYCNSNIYPLHKEEFYNERIRTIRCYCGKCGKGDYVYNKDDEKGRKLIDERKKLIYGKRI